MVLVLAGQPAFLLAMRDCTVGWIGYYQGQITQVEAAFT